MLKLIALTQDGRFSEIDWVRLRRVGRAIVHYVAKASPEEDAIHGLRARLLPFVEKAIAGGFSVPYVGPVPYHLNLQWEGSEPAFSQELFELYAEFYVTLGGIPPLPSERDARGKRIHKPDVMIDGKAYKEAEFED